MLQEIFRLMSHHRHHSQFSDSTPSHSCSLSLIWTFIPDSHSLLLSLLLCGSSNNWHYLGLTENYDDDEDEDAVLGRTDASSAASRTPRGKVQNHIVGEIGCCRDMVEQQWMTCAQTCACSGNLTRSDIQSKSLVASDSGSHPLYRC